MKKATIIAIVLIALFATHLFDPIVLFLLSGSLPFFNITLPPSTMLAVLVASTILVFALRRRHFVYRNCLELYDEFFIGKKKKSTPVDDDTKSKLPRRRYQQL